MLRVSTGGRCVWMRYLVPASPGSDSVSGLSSAVTSGKLLFLCCTSVFSFADWRKLALIIPRKLENRVWHGDNKWHCCDGCLVVT